MKKTPTMRMNTPVPSCIPFLITRHSLQVLRQQPDLEQRLHRPFVRRFPADSRGKSRFSLHSEVLAEHNVLSAAFPLSRKLPGDSRVVERGHHLCRRHGGPFQRAFGAANQRRITESWTWNLQTARRNEGRVS